MQHAHAFEPVQDGRIYIEKLNGPFLFGDKGTPAEYALGLAPRARDRPVRLTDARAQHFAKSVARTLETEPTAARGIRPSQAFSTARERRGDRRRQGKPECLSISKVLRG